MIFLKKIFTRPSRPIFTSSAGFFVAVLAATFFFVATPSIASAASLIVSPASGSYNTGQNFSVSVFVASPDTAVNAISGRLSVPTDKLDIVGVSTSGSIISFWVSGPTIDNASGTVNFEGVALNPGYQGNAGRVVTITLRGKSAGVADVVLSSGAVLANDGRGTNVLTSLGRGRFTIQGVTTPPVQPPPTDPEGFSRAIISSPSHPDPNRWYSASSGSISWIMPPTATGVNVEIDQRPDTALTALSRGRISTRAFSDLSDGVWYAHVRLRGPDGWVATSHFPIRIDTTPPDSVSVIPVREDPSSPVVHLMVRGTDALSGIDRFDIEIDGSSPITWRDDGTGIFATPPLAPGAHTLTAYAVDQAGNRRPATAMFTVEPRDKTTLGLIAGELCNQYCPQTWWQYVLYSGFILLILLSMAWRRRRQIKKKIHVLERDLAHLERVVRHEAVHVEKVLAQDVHMLEADALSVGKATKRWFSMRSADHQLHKRFAKLAEKVEREVLILEEKKASRGLTPHEARRLKDLMEVLQDTTSLRHHPR